MNNHLRKVMIIQHRKTMYERALQKLIDGNASPEYVTKRYQKLKEAKGK